MRIFGYWLLVIGYWLLVISYWWCFRLGIGKYKNNLIPHSFNLYP